MLALVGLALGAVLWCRGQRRRAAFPLLAVVGGVAIVQLAKLLVARPTTWIPVWGRLTTTNDSFPSGHALQAIVFWGLMAVLVLERAPSTRGRWAIVAATAIVVAVVGYTRVYLGHHWPSDVLGGWLAGWAWLGPCSLSAGAPALPVPCAKAHRGAACRALTMVGTPYAAPRSSLRPEARA